MKKKNIGIQILLFCSMFVSAMEQDLSKLDSKHTKVRLLGVEQLREAFEKENLGDFAYHTKIHEHWGDKELSLGLVNNIADTFRTVYLEYLITCPNKEISSDLVKKEKILECMLHGASVLEKTDQHLDGIQTMYTLPDTYALKGIIKEVTSELFVKSSYETKKQSKL